MTATCPDCGAAAPRRFAATDRNRRTTAERFDYFSCPACGLLFVDPIPADLGRFYPSDYYVLPSTRAELVDGSRPHDSYKVDVVRSLVPSGRLVELGPGIGGFAALAQDAGYEASAIETDEGASRYLEDVVGVPTVNTSDAAAALEAGGPFDVIALWHVIEHLADPWGTLAAAAQALSPGGVVIIGAPNPEALQLRLFGARWTHVDAPRHLFLLPIASLERAGARLGLEPALATHTDAGTLAWNKFGWRETLAHSVTSVRGGHALRMVGSVLAGLAGPLERRGRRGATYTVAMRKAR